LVFGALAFLQNGLGAFLVVPEIRGGDFFFEGLQASAIRLRVKDNSAPE